MLKKLTTEEFIRRAKEVHGDKYDYSKVEYINNKTKVCIICPIHGEFWQTPKEHLFGQGCPKCRNENRKKIIFGVGINDSDEVIHINGECFPSYKHWYLMMRRCFDIKTLERNPTYKYCSVCDEWKYYSNFKKWFDEHYVDGWCLDKDILIKGNKIYSPETCCFVPNEINLLFTKRQNCRGILPIGVSSSGLKYKAYMNIYNKKKYLGTYNSKEEAFSVYKANKESYIKEMAIFFRNKISPKVYNALMNYKVEITD